MSKIENYNLLISFHTMQKKFPKNMALWDQEIHYSYEELGLVVAKLASLLMSKGIKVGDRVGIMATHGHLSIIGILGCCWIGATYIPLNVKQPTARLQSIIDTTDLSALIYDGVALEKKINNQLDISLLSKEHLIYLQSDRDNYSNLSILKNVTPLTQLVPVSEESLAYIMFTSGTTGIPKGVLIKVKNVKSLINALSNKYKVNEKDRMSQYFEHTFDASIYDIFLPLSSGAYSIIVPESKRLSPDKFIQSMELTIWASVPSVAVFLSKLKKLKKNCFPKLRLSTFGGEALLYNTARLWQDAAPNSVIDNHYGPTEICVMCTSYKFDNKIRSIKYHDFIPIGQAFGELHVAIVDKNNVFLNKNQEGELVVAGPQVGAGYWKMENYTNKKFIELNHPVYGQNIWYKTGDLTFEDKDGNFHFISRIDNQIQLFGHRIELSDIDSKMRRIINNDSTACIVWPVEDNLPQGIVTFFTHSTLSGAKIKSLLKKELPAYMIPRKVIKVEHIPININGKIDSGKLFEWAEKNKYD